MNSSWTSRAACANRPDLPWTRDMADLHPLHAATMRAVCDGCPVVFDCLAAVDDLDVTGGFWAGADRDPNAADPLARPDWVTAPGEPSATSVETGVCWMPRRVMGTVHEQGAYVLQCNNAGLWYLGGVA